MVVLSTIGDLNVGDIFISAASRDKRRAPRFVVSGDIDGKARECWDIKNAQLVYKSCRMAVYKLSSDPNVTVPIIKRYESAKR